MYPANDQLSYFLFELQEKAAVRIQSTWRGCRVRRQIAESREAVRRDRAARRLQRAVRDWAHTRELHEAVPTAGFERISEDTLQELQREIGTWDAKYGKVKFETFEQVESQHNHVQSLLKEFYSAAATRRLEDQNTETTCANIEATVHLLQNSPDLTRCRNVDLSMYCCRPLQDAAAARLSHKQQLNRLRSPWWKKL
ncbi:IQ calmodulin-binding motif-containing protein 1-like [Bacillus rossius redtenbacheri]|uniref:IQ calmodulin-binding motif-containing protein 1-like n=1 Tax=Bacillus rossius redtenbacheri TaxID=93214 RepID=UPI002FDDC6CA